MKFVPFFSEGVRIPDVRALIVSSGLPQATLESLQAEALSVLTDPHSTNPQPTLWLNMGFAAAF